VRIALVADTHIPTAIHELPSQLLEHLKRVDLILHAGDLVCPEVLESLRKVARTIAVYGNADEPDVVRQLPYKQSLTLAGKSIGLIHGNQPPEIEREYLKPEYDYDSPPVGAFYEFLLNEFPEAEIIIFGHLNMPLVKREHNRLLINPGSVAPYRGHCSFGILHLDPGGAEAEIIEL
jgi:putative phosphoesterase